MTDFAEYVKMFDYTKNAVENILFKDSKGYEIKSSDTWSNDFVPWKEENQNIEKKTYGWMYRCFSDDFRNRDMAEKR